MIKNNEQISKLEQILKDNLEEINAVRVAYIENMEIRHKEYNGKMEHLLGINRMGNMLIESEEEC